MSLVTALKNSSKLFVFALLSLALQSCSEVKRSYKLTMAHTLDEAHAVHQAFVHMSERLAHYSNGEMSIQIYANGQLGSERESIELLQIGSLDMTKVSASPLEGFVPEMQLFSIPYIFRDHDHYWKVLDSPLGQALLAKLAKANLHGLGYFDAGSRSFYTSFGPVKQPADLAGKKIRVMKSQTAIKMVNTLGGSATPISWGELYSALQQGVVDGAENNPPTFFLSRHYEVSKYYTLDEHTSVPDILLMSEVTWQKLNQQQQNWVRLAAQDAVSYQKALWQQATETALEEVQKRGVQVIRPDKTPFIQAVKPMHKSYQGTEVGKLLQQINNIQ